jgi:hypothetical protein
MKKKLNDDEIENWIEEHWQHMLELWKCYDN